MGGHDVGRSRVGRSRVGRSRMGRSRVAVTPVHIATTTLEAYARSLSAPRWSPPGRFIILSAITHSVFLWPGVMHGLWPG